MHGAHLSAKDYPGVIMDVSIDDKGDLDRESYMVEVKDGKQVVKETLPPVRRSRALRGAARGRTPRLGGGAARQRKRGQGPRMSDFLQLVVSGTATGAIYALAALGFTLLWQASGTINFAQGEFVMLPAFVMLSSWRSAHRSGSRSC